MLFSSRRRTTEAFLTSPSLKFLCDSDSNFQVIAPSETMACCTYVSKVLPLEECCLFNLPLAVRIVVS